MEGRSLGAAFAHGQTRQLERTDPTSALAMARRSIELAPRNPHYYAAAGSLALTLSHSGEKEIDAEWLQKAVDYYRAAIDCDPYRASYHWRLARAIVAAGGHLDQVVEQLRAANALNPTKQLYREDLAAAEESVRQSTPALLEFVPAKMDE
jgi:tetratricopeptide (TPR) repeat protein